MAKLYAQLNIKLDQDLIERLEAAVEASRESKSGWIIAAIEARLAAEAEPLEPEEPEEN